MHLLWLQEKARSKELQIRKIDGSKNPADLFTKHLDQHTLDRYSHELGLMAEPGGRRGPRSAVSGVRMYYT